MRVWIRRLIENYDDSKYDSYCELIDDIETIQSTHSRREDPLNVQLRIVNTIKDFLLIPRDDSILSVSDEHKYDGLMLVPNGAPMFRLEKKRGEGARTEAAQAELKNGRRKQPNKSKQSRIGEELRAMGDDKIDAQMRNRHRSRNQTQYEHSLHNHQNSAHYSDGEYEMFDSTYNPYVIKF